MTENDAKTIDDCLKELKDHRDVYLKRSTPWRIVNRAVRLIEELKEYREIGTVEEFKDLKEKNEEKRVIGIDAHLLTRHCPSCSGWMGFEIKRGMKYCPNCGQKLNWRGEKQ